MQPLPEGGWEPQDVRVFKPDQREPKSGPDIREAAHIITRFSHKTVTAGSAQTSISF